MGKASMKLPFLNRLLVAILSLSCHLGKAQDTSRQPSAAGLDEAFSLDIGGFTNFVNNNYGRWSGGEAKIMYRGSRFSPSFNYAYQRRPEGHQSTLGFDSYVNFNRWFYIAGGIGGAPEGTAVLYPQLRYGVTGFLIVPGGKGLVATLGASQVHGKDESYSRTLSAGALYYRGPAIVSGNISFNRAYPGAHPSKSGAMAIQFGAQNKYWLGAGMSGGKIAYQTISLDPLNVRFLTYGPNIFFQKWITEKFGFTLKYDYQNQLEAFRRHGIAMNLFFEFQ